MGSLMQSADSFHRPDFWPPLPLAEWQDTRDTLHMWTQVVGKVRMALSPRVNHWWEVPLYVTARGLTTSPIPYDNGVVELQFDFLAHVLTAQTSTGGVKTLPLGPRAVADFYAELMDMLKTLGINVKIWPMPVEIPNPIRFDQDRVHASYDPEYAQRFWRVLVGADTVFKAFRARFIGKSSPVHFFWGGFDLAATRFSGRLAPDHGPVPFTPARIVREAYSHEVSSCGFWPGAPGLDGPIFYSYAYPEPLGYRDAAVKPRAALYDPNFAEFLLPYDAVRQARDPDAYLLEFLQSTYEAAADLADWDRPTLEHRPLTAERPVV